MYIRKKHAENARIKRPNKKLKNYDTIFSSKYGAYLKLTIMWILFFLIDFLMDFRIEIFWSCWLMCRSINETYRYQGLVFTLFFILTVITSDLICFLLIPTKWMFFLGCTYVWIQLIGIADRSISAFTVGSCVFYVYIEFSFRLRQVTKNLSFTLNICRPFAAHCIGYPVVSMCFELKNYVSHKFRIRRQNEVRRINQFYYELLDKAIPEELRQFTYNADNDGNSVPDSIENSSTSSTGKQDKKKALVNGKIKSSKWAQTNLSDIPDSVSQSNANLSPSITAFLNALPSPEDGDDSYQDISVQDNDDFSVLRKTKRKHLCAANGLSLSNENSHMNLSEISKNQKEDFSTRLESQLKRFKSELQVIRKNESDLKAQISQLQQSEIQMKTEIKTIKSEIQPSHIRLQQSQQRFIAEKQIGQALEKKLTEEKKIRQQLQSQLDLERRSRMEDSEAKSRAIQAVVVAAARSVDCGDSCRKQRKDIENEIVSIRKDVRTQDERILSMSRQTSDWSTLLKVADDHRDLANRIATIKDEILHLTEQLRELNKMKQELLTSYHSSQLEIKDLDYVIKKKNYQIMELQSKLQSQIPITDYNTSTTHMYGLEPSNHVQHSYKSYSPSYCHQTTTSANNRHSTSNSPLYMSYTNTHSS